MSKFIHSGALFWGVECFKTVFPGDVWEPKVPPGFLRSRSLGGHVFFVYFIRVWEAFWIGGCSGVWGIEFFIVV